MLRTLVLALLLANMLLWAWSHDALRPFGWAPARVGEPWRLREDLHADRVVLEGPDGSPLPAARQQREPPPAGSASHAAAAPPASAPRAAPSAGVAADPGASSTRAAASAAAASATQGATAAGSAPATSPAPSPASAPASAPTSAPARSPAQSPASAAAAQARQTRLCLRIGPYDSAPDAKLGAALRAAGLQALARSYPLPAQWMVLMGPYSDPAAMQRKLAQLRQLALPAGSFIPVGQRPRYMPGISLGVFDQREQALQQLAHLQARGVQTAHVVQRNLGIQGSYWVLPALDPQQARRLRSLPALQAADRHPRPCPG